MGGFFHLPNNEMSGKKFSPQAKPYFCAWFFLQ